MQLRIGERNVPKRDVILKDRNGRFIMNENLSILDMMEPHISSIQQFQCGSNICNIKGDITQKVGPTMLEYFQI